VTQGAGHRRDLIGPDGPTLSITTAGRDTIATVAGELDLAAVAKMSPTINAVVRTPPARVVLDLNGVTFIDSRGLAMIVHLLRRLEAKDSRLVVVCPPGAARQAMELAGVARMLSFGESVYAVLASS
jgi:anti-sigma B factor antagonist